MTSRTQIVPAPSINAVFLFFFNALLFMFSTVSFWICEYLVSPHNPKPMLAVVFYSLSDIVHCFVIGFYSVSNVIKNFNVF